MNVSDRKERGSKSSFQGIYIAVQAEPAVLCVCFFLCQIDCPVIKDNIGCDILPTFFSTILGLVPQGIGSIAAGITSMAVGHVCGDP